MSTIGKIFTVLNLILAAAFLGWAAQALKSNQEYKQRYEKTVSETTAERNRLVEENTKRSADIVEKDKRNQALTNERDSLGADKKRLEETVADLRGKGATMQASLDKISQTLEGIETSKTQLQADKDKADKAQRDADAARLAADEARAAADKVANDTKAELEKANTSIATLEKDVEARKKSGLALELQMQTLVANTGANPADFMPVPEIKGGVLDVSMAVEPGIVALNVGTNKGVKRGFTFAIYDGKTYKGEARVEYVHADMASAIITRKVAGQTIRQGDSATTRL
jgi:hypothetical protein